MMLGSVCEEVMIERIDKCNLNEWSSEARGEMHLTKDGSEIETEWGLTSLAINNNKKGLFNKISSYIQKK